MLDLRNVLSLQDDVVSLLPLQQRILYVPSDNAPAEAKKLEKQGRRFGRRLSDESIQVVRDPVRMEVLSTSLENQPSFLQNGSMIASSKRKSQFGGAFRITVVDFTSDGALIIARDSLDEVGRRFTILDSYDPSTMEYNNLLCLKDSKTVIAATMNSSRSLVAFTTVTKVQPDLMSLLSERKKRHPHETDYVYEVWMAEINPQGTVFCLSQFCSKKYTRLQFLVKDQSKNASQFLCIVDSQDVGLYKIGLQKRAGCPGVRINSHPQFIKEIATNIIWFQWDPFDSYLYIIQKHLKHKEPNELVFRCFEFVGGKMDRPVLDTVLKLERPNPKRVSWAISGKRAVPFLWMNGFASPSSNIQVVRMPDRGLCICQQDLIEGSSGQDHSLYINIYVLHHQCRISYRIPLKETPFHVAERTFAFFGNLLDMLLVFIPGHYFHLHDCGQSHEPCSSLLITDPNFVPQIPGAEQNQHPSLLIPFQFSRILERRRSKQGTRSNYMFLDSSTGIIYEYKLKIESLSRLVSQEWFHQRAQVIHLVSIHIQDQDLCEKLIRDMITSRDANFPSAAIEEYIVSNVHLRMKGRSSESIFSNYILATTLVARASQHLQVKDFVCDVEIAQLICPLNNTELIGQKVKNQSYTMMVDAIREKLYLHRKMSQLHSEKHNATPGPSIGMRGLIGRLFVSSPSGVFTTSNVSNEEAIHQMKLVDALASYFTSLNLTSDRDKCTRAARVYLEEQAKCTSFLYEEIFKCLDPLGATQMKPRRPMINSFTILEGLYYGLENLGLPFPYDFHDRFCLIGFKCLPRSLFTQYLDRGVFKLRFFSVNEIISGLDTRDPCDLSLRNRVIAHLNFEDFINSYPKYRESANLRYVMEYLLSMVPEPQVQPDDLRSSMLEQFDEQEISQESISTTTGDDSSEDLSASYASGSSLQMSQVLISPDELLPLSVYLSTMQNKRIELSTNSPSASLSRKSSRKFLRVLTTQDAAPSSSLDTAFIANAAKHVSRKGIQRHFVTKSGSWFVQKPKGDGTS